MGQSAKRQEPKGPSRVPPLLPWQPCLLAYGAGILAAHFLTAAFCALLLLLAFPRPAKGRPPIAAIAGTWALGLLVGLVALPAVPRDLAPCLTSHAPLTVTGRVAAVGANPEARLSVTLEDVQLSDPDCKDAPLPGRLSLTIDRPAFRPIPGDRLAVTARVRPTRGFENPGTADYAFSRRLEDVFFRAYARGDKDGQVRRIAPSRDLPAVWREALRRRVMDNLVPPEHADAAGRAGRAMVAALVFGDRSGLTETDVDLVRRASLAHTLALSGMHVGFVAAMGAALAALLGRLWPRIHLSIPRPHLIALFAAPPVAAYCWLGGLTPSLTRAALMFAAFGLMALLRRDRALLDGLFLALAAILLVSPLAAYDPRLQLSALAVSGIGVFWPLFPRFSRHVPFTGPAKSVFLWVGGTLWVSLCAEAAVMPLISRLYGDLTPNPWINLLWLPVLGGVAMPLALAGLVASILPGLAGLGAGLLGAAAACCEGLMRLLAAANAHGLLLSSAVLRPGWIETLGCLGLLAALAMAVSGGRRPVAAMAASLVLLVFPTVWRSFSDMREVVRITVLDVGQGQSVALALPGGRRLLVDAGGLFGNFDVGRAVVGAFLTDGRPPRLAAAFASHPHRDHIKGFISLLDRFSIGNYYDNGGAPEGNLAVPIEGTLAKRRIPHASLAAGDAFDLGDGLRLAVLHPGPDDALDGNNGSLILRLTWNGRGLAVIPGDAERGVLRRLAASGEALDAAVLVLPHHGSVTGLAKRFYAAVSPRVAIASCGDGGRYPAGKVAATLERLGCAVYATNRDGAVTVRFDTPEGAPRVDTAGQLRQ
ncbi:ComEC/Rec2-related protein [Solidesulfovibrio fructosivorans JJ]]|uniref:ComEC/Rec2-related protein n=1 Tax=Solidesulfovibrio fructosivorans JJ] TaxID=596151 RepID=E1JUN0_SOLFR|nr:ComEC/Rec2 family competence protein [Solidesulfovibrio fructosivorans]EFL51794.1 ComEC/Rec2-related protein [Solidesulfovibrio fructosivorans JJ]]